MFRLEAGASLFLHFLVGCLTLSCTSGGSHVSKQVVASVGDQTLLVQPFADRLAQRLRSVDPLAVKNPAVVKQAKEEIVSEFATQAVTAEWAKKNQIKVTDEELDHAVVKVIHEYPDETAFRESLSRQRIEFDNWKEQFRQGLLQKKVIAKISEHVTPPSEEEIASYFKANQVEYSHKAQARLRQVVVAKEDQAQIVWKAAQKDHDLQKLAKQYSIAPEGKKGGDLGWVDKGTLAVFDEAFSLSHNGISQVIKSPYGYHVIQLLDKRPDAQLKLSDVHDTIKRQLIEDREQAQYSKWMEEQLRSIKVMRDDPLIQSITVEIKRD